uniref:Uncharacterized protein LOC104219162 n=1 Tax=Nicotiana sylvestris TaxID=4096 RepID=A0A1U7VJ46_NICSY|nr:PREDICTED: uncharacterized protein LOC104219162 [Nicotiana sylvestris]
METYSSVVDAITFRHLINLVVHEKLEMRLMDIVITYLYGSLDNEIFMKIPEGFKVPEAQKSSRETCSIKLQKFLYGLKQSGRMWYNRLSEYLLKERYKDDPICPCVFIKRSRSEFVIIAVYVDDLNIIGTSKELLKDVEYYLSDPHKARSQTRYLFTYGGTTLSWRSMKQTIAVTSSNHTEIIAIHEANRKCIWLRSMTQHIQEMCGLLMKKDNPTTLYEDNAACIAQLKGGYIKGDRTKHISSKFFFTHDLQQNGEINVQQIRSYKNLADLFTKALPTSTFEKLIRKIGMRRLREIK